MFVRLQGDTQWVLLQSWGVRYYKRSRSHYIWSFDPLFIQKYWTSQLPRNNPAIRLMTHKYSNISTCENKNKWSKDIGNCSSTHQFIDSHHGGATSHTLLLHLFTRFTFSFLLALERLGSTVPHISNYTAALSTAVTHRLTQATSTLITVTWCSAGQASLAWSANSGAAC